MVDEEKKSKIAQFNTFQGLFGISCGKKILKNAIIHYL